MIEGVELGTQTAPVTRPKPRAGRRALLVFFGLLVILVAGAVVLGLLPRMARDKALLAASQAVADRLPIVNVAAARPAPAKSELELPGDIQALVESPIFARADGYLRKRLVDIGDRVRAGQVMAEIETPELDQQIQQARATLAQSESALKELEAGLVLSQANLKLAQVTLDRWKSLAGAGVFSHQDADEKQAAFDVRRAEVDAAAARINTTRETLHANEANLRRLEQLKSFDTVTAPFDGIVTARNVDVGTLINAGNGGPAKEMFRVAQIRTLRIFVNVPQTYVGSIRAGQTAELRVQELPGRVFPAHVSHISNALDPNSRSMLVYVEVPNPQGILLPGMYAQIRFIATRPAAALLIPGDALILSREGPRVATVGADHKVHFRDIHIARDLGSELEVDSGLSRGDLVVTNPTDFVREGAAVDVHGAGR